MWLRVAAIAALLLPGCSIHPLPEDVTGETTYQIVQKVRCEAREALTSLAVRALRESYSPPTLELAAQLEAGDITIIDLFQDPKNRSKVDPEVHRNFDVFALSSAGFEFAFTMSETNHHSASASFRMPFTDGTFNLNTGAGKTLERQNERNFKAGHTFIELYERTDARICSQIAARVGNFIYPITGKVGLEEVFGTFYSLNRPYNPKLRGIPGEAYRNFRQGGDVTKFSDALAFTTTLVATADPSVALDAGPIRQLRLAKASLSASATRMDLHRLTITVATGKRVASLQQARGLVGLRAAIPAAEAARTRAVQRLYELRREEFFAGINEERRLLGLPPL